MNSSTIAIKKTAKAAMSGKISKCIIATIIPIFATLCCIILSQIFLYIKPLKAICGVLMVLLFVFALMPLYFGTLRFYWRMYLDGEDDVVSQFIYFSDFSKYSRAMKLILKLFVRAVGYGLVFFAPAMILTVLSNNKLYDLIGIAMPTMVSNFWIISNFLELVAVFALLWVMLRYYMAVFFLIADEDMEPEEAMHMSRIISKNSGIEFVFLALSFLPWVLLTIFVVPSLITVPYMIMAYLVHCRFITARYNHMVKEIAKCNTPTFSVDF